MFTFSSIADLPFQEGDVAAHFEFPDGVTVTELRAHSISPSGNFCAGTALFTPVGMTQIARGFILKNTPSGTVPSWTVEPNFPLPTDWESLSIRGINDKGDICGFFLDRLDPDSSARPYIKRFAHEPKAITIPPAAPMPNGQVWDISNGRFICGEYTDAQDEVKGYKAKFEPDGSISDFDEFPVERIKSFDSHRALLYVEGGVHFYQFGKGPCDGQKSNLTANPIFGNALQVMMNGINASRHIVGFFGAPASNPGRRGFIGQFKENCLLDPFVFSHPSSPKDTRLFSISDDGIVVGSRDLKKPFFMIAKNS